MKTYRKLKFWQKPIKMPTGTYSSTSYYLTEEIPGPTFPNDRWIASLTSNIAEEAQEVPKSINTNY